MPPRGAESYRPGFGRDYDDREFTFRNPDNRAPQYPPRDFDRYEPRGSHYDPRDSYYDSQDSHRYPPPPPPPPPRPHDNYPTNSYRPRERETYQDSRRGDRGPMRRDRPKSHYQQPSDRRAANRPLLRVRRSRTPELFGDGEAPTKPGRYLALDQISLTDSEDMSIDDADDDGHLGNSSEPPTKRRMKTKADDADEKPKWSNPDPYTALPPPDESSNVNKRQDFVKLIRKARVTAEAEKEKANAVTANDDFISFDFKDVNDNQTDSAAQFDDAYRMMHSGVGVAGAPTEPRANRLGPNDHIDPYPRDTGPDMPPHKSNLDLPPMPTNAQPIKPTFLPAHQSNIPIIASKESDPALGSRKRTRDDQIKGGKRTRYQGRGEVMKEWRPVSIDTATPWYDPSHAPSENPGFA